jgi:hypothetical protein
MAQYFRLPGKVLFVMPASVILVGAFAVSFFDSVRIPSPPLAPPAVTISKAGALQDTGDSGADGTVQVDQQLNNAVGIPFFKPDTGVSDTEFN